MKMDHVIRPIGILSLATDGKSIATVDRAIFLSPITSLKSWACVVVAKIQVVIRIALKETRSSDCRSLPAMRTAPVSKAQKPIPFKVLRINQCLPPPFNSLYQVVMDMIAALDQMVPIPKQLDAQRQIGTRAHLNARTCLKVILPDGIGLSGLFSVSSVIAVDEHDWFAVVNWSRCSQTQRTSSMKC